MTIYDESIKLSNDDKYNYVKLNDKLEIYREMFRKYAIGGFTINHDKNTYPWYKPKFNNNIFLYRFTATVCPYCRHPINGDEITPYCYTCGVKVRLR